MKKALVFICILLTTYASGQDIPNPEIFAKGLVSTLRRKSGKELYALTLQPQEYVSLLQKLDNQRIKTAHTAWGDEMDVKETIASHADGLQTIFEVNQIEVTKRLKSITEKAEQLGFTWTTMQCNNIFFRIKSNNPDFVTSEISIILKYGKEYFTLEAYAILSNGLWKLGKLRNIQRNGMEEKWQRTNTLLLPASFPSPYPIANSIVSKLSKVSFEAFEKELMKSVDDEIEYLEKLGQLSKMMEEENQLFNKTSVEDRKFSSFTYYKTLDEFKVEYKKDVLKRSKSIITDDILINGMYQKGIVWKNIEYVKTLFAIEKPELDTVDYVTLEMAIVFKYKNKHYAIRHGSIWQKGWQISNRFDPLIEMDNENKNILR